MKVRASVLREFSVASFPVVVTVTSAVGSASRTTVYVEELPASVVRRLPEPSMDPVSVMVTPLVSSSVFLTVVVVDSPLYPPALFAVAVRVVVMSPSSMESLTPVIVTV